LFDVLSFFVSLVVFFGYLVLLFVVRIVCFGYMNHKINVITELPLKDALSMTMS